MGIGTGPKWCCWFRLSLKHHSLGQHFVKVLGCSRAPLQWDSQDKPAPSPTLLFLHQFNPKPRSQERLGRSSGLHPSRPPRFPTKLMARCHHTVKLQSAGGLCSANYHRCRSLTEPVSQQLAQVLTEVTGIALEMGLLPRSHIEASYKPGGGAAGDPGRLFPGPWRCHTRHERTLRLPAHVHGDTRWEPDGDGVTRAGGAARERLCLFTTAAGGSSARCASPCRRGLVPAPPTAGVTGGCSRERPHARSHPGLRAAPRRAAAGTGLGPRQVPRPAAHS